MSKIITRYDPPPIPDRRFDWRAYHDADDGDGQHVGWGCSEQEARDDLARLDEERAEAEEIEARESSPYREYEHEDKLDPWGEQ